MVKELKLKVAEAIQDDVNKGIVRIDSSFMHELGIRPGDIIEIKGERKTVAITDRAYPGDIGLNIIRMDGLIRRNAKAGIGEIISIKKGSVIEAKKVFNIDYQKIKILIHPKSYIHAILKFNNGLTNIIVHDTTMKVPIFNTLFLNSNRKLKTNKINKKILKNLNLNNVNVTRYPMIKLLNFLPDNNSLFETVIVAANDKLVELFLSNKIKFTDIQKKLFKTS